MLDTVDVQFDPHGKFAFGTIKKHPTATRTLRLDFFPLVADFWEVGKQSSVNDIVRPLTATGFAYQAGANGQAGTEQPAWPQTLAGTVVDGEVTWTAIAAGVNGVTAVSAPAVTVVPSGGLSAGSPSVINGKGTSTAVEFTLSGGVVGKTYRVECQVTVGTETLVGSVEVKGVLK
jgi:hypothetical protein